MNNNQYVQTTCIDCGVTRTVVVKKGASGRCPPCGQKARAGKAEPRIIEPKHVDNGCKLVYKLGGKKVTFTLSSCLSCPLDECKHDNPEAALKWAKNQ